MFRWLLFRWLYGSGTARLVILSTWFTLALTQSNWRTTPFNVPALPLAVRSPYLNVWLKQGGNPESLNNAFPDFWEAVSVFGWYSSVMVDGTPYKLLAETNVPEISLANQTALEWTATRTSFIFTAGPMQVNMSFISPIEPADLLRQSIPFSYITMSASATDGNTHDVRMFINTNGELITGQTSLVAEWDAQDDDEHTILSMQLRNGQRRFTEISNHAQDAVHYFCLKKISGTTSSWAITNNNANHALAANTSGTLGNQADTNFRAVNENWPTLGLAIDWTDITETPEPAVWAVGLVRSPTVQYRTPDGSIQERYPYWMSAYNDGIAAAKSFLDDSSRALAISSVFDSAISTAGQQVSQEYADLLSLSALQLMGSMDITIPRGGGGGWNMSDVKVFMKNMGGIGTDAVGSTLSVNTVDTLYAAFPGLLYLNPELAGYLLSPLLEYQASSAYTLSYAARNIGSAYPNATADGINSVHDYAVEGQGNNYSKWNHTYSRARLESANMLIMTLAYAQRSGNGTFLSRHYMLLSKWAQYLEQNALAPLNQKSPDFTTGSLIQSTNQTNTAIKGIIGIACMAKIAEIAGVEKDQERFNNTAASYVSQWQANVVASDNTHIAFFYGQSNTNGLIYNLYADKLLQLNLVPSSVYDVVASFYNEMTGQTTYGIPLSDQDPDRATTHWMMFAAATVTGESTRNSMISQLHTYAAGNYSVAPLPVIYNPSTGSTLDGANAGYNSPASGAMFSLLALNTTIHSSINLPPEGSTIPSGDSSSDSPSSSSKSNVGAIAGGTVGGVVALIAILIGLFLWLRRRRRQREDFESKTRAVPIFPSDLGTSTAGYTSTSQGLSSPVYMTNNRPMAEQKLLIEVDERLPAQKPEPRGSASDADVMTENTNRSGTGTSSGARTRTRTGTRSGSGPGSDGRGEALRNVFRGALDDREFLTREITSIRRELEMMRHEGTFISEALPSYSGSDAGRYT